MQFLLTTLARSCPPKLPVTFIVSVKRLSPKGAITFRWPGGSNFQWQTYEDSLKGKCIGPVMLPLISLRFPPQAVN